MGSTSIQIQNINIINVALCAGLEENLPIHAQW
jgi:hypothetical protein